MVVILLRQNSMKFPTPFLIIFFIASNSVANMSMCDAVFSSVLIANNGKIKSPSDMNMYFVMLRLFKEKKFSSIIEILPRLKEMGINSIWISPPQPQTEAGPPIFTLNDHGYWPKNHHEIDPAYGGEVGFRDFVEKANSLGIEICLDAVLNHFGYAEFVEINGKRISTKDPNYFIIPPEHHGSSYHPDEQYLWDKMEKSNDINELRELKQKFEDFTIYGLPTLNWHNPEVYAYMVSSYKKFVDRGVFTFRIDAAKHLPTDQLVRFSNEISAYAKSKGKKAKFIWEFFISNSEPMALYAKDAIQNLEDKTSTFFFDFPMMREFRRLQDSNYSFEWLAGFVRYRLDNKHPLEHMVPIVEDHDSGAPIRDIYRNLLIYSASEFFSMNQTVVYQGTEQAGRSIETRQHVDNVNENGNVIRLKKLLGEALSPYRMKKTPAVHFHRSEHDIIVAERNLDNKRSIFLAANKSGSAVEIEISPAVLKQDSTIKEILGFTQPEVTLSPDGKLKLILPPYSFTSFEII